MPPIETANYQNFLDELKTIKRKLNKQKKELAKKVYGTSDQSIGALGEKARQLLEKTPAELEALGIGVASEGFEKLNVSAIKQQEEIKQIIDKVNKLHEDLNRLVKENEALLKSLNLSKYDVNTEELEAQLEAVQSIASGLEAELTTKTKELQVQRESFKDNLKEAEVKIEQSKRIIFKSKSNHEYAAAAIKVYEYGEAYPTIKDQLHGGSPKQKEKKLNKILDSHRKSKGGLEKQKAKNKKALDKAIDQLVTPETYRSMGVEQLQNASFTDAENFREILRANVQYNVTNDYIRILQMSSATKISYEKGLLPRVVRLESASISTATTETELKFQAITNFKTLNKIVGDNIDKHELVSNMIHERSHEPKINLQDKSANISKRIIWLEDLYSAPPFSDELREQICSGLTNVSNQIIALEQERASAIFYNAPANVIEEIDKRLSASNAAFDTLVPSLKGKLEGLISSLKNANDLSPAERIEVTERLKIAARVLDSLKNDVKETQKITKENYYLILASEAITKSTTLSPSSILSENSQTEIEEIRNILKQRIDKSDLFFEKNSELIYSLIEKSETTNPLLKKGKSTVHKNGETSFDFIEDFIELSEVYAEAYKEFNIQGLLLNQKYKDEFPKSGVITDQAVDSAIAKNDEQLDSGFAQKRKALIQYKVYRLKILHMTGERQISTDEIDDIIKNELKTEIENPMFGEYKEMLEEIIEQQPYSAFTSALATLELGDEDKKKLTELLKTHQDAIENHGKDLTAESMVDVRLSQLNKIKPLYNYTADFQAPILTGFLSKEVSELELDKMHTTFTQRIKEGDNNLKENINVIYTLIKKSKTKVSFERGDKPTTLSSEGQKIIPQQDFMFLSKEIANNNQKLNLKGLSLIEIYNQDLPNNKVLDEASIDKAIGELDSTTDNDTLDKRNDLVQFKILKIKSLHLTGDAPLSSDDINNMIENILKTESSHPMYNEYKKQLEAISKLPTYSGCISALSSLEFVDEADRKKISELMETHKNSIHKYGDDTCALTLVENRAEQVSKINPYVYTADFPVPTLKQFVERLCSQDTGTAKELLKLGSSEISPYIHAETIKIIFTDKINGLEKQIASLKRMDETPENLEKLKAAEFDLAESKKAFDKIVVSFKEIASRIDPNLVAAKLKSFNKVHKLCINNLNITQQEAALDKNIMDVSSWIKELRNKHKDDADFEKQVEEQWAAVEATASETRSEWYQERTSGLENAEMAKSTLVSMHTRNISDKESDIKTINSEIEKSKGKIGRLQASIDKLKAWGKTLLSVFSAKTPTLDDGALLNSLELAINRTDAYIKRISFLNSLPESSFALRSQDGQTSYSTMRRFYLYDENRHHTVIESEISNYDNFIQIVKASKELNPLSRAVISMRAANIAIKGIEDGMDRSGNTDLKPENNAIIVQLKTVIERLKKDFPELSDIESFLEKNPRHDVVTLMKRNPSADGKDWSNLESDIKNTKLNVELHSPARFSKIQNLINVYILAKGILSTDSRAAKELITGYLNDPNLLSFIKANKSKFKSTKTIKFENPLDETFMSNMINLKKEGIKLKLDDSSIINLINSLGEREINLDDTNMELLTNMLGKAEYTLKLDNEMTILTEDPIKAGQLIAGLKALQSTNCNVNIPKDLYAKLLATYAISGFDSEDHDNPQFHIETLLKPDSNIKIALKKSIDITEQMKHVTFPQEDAQKILDRFLFLTSINVKTHLPPLDYSSCHFPDTLRKNRKIRSNDKLFKGEEFITIIHNLDQISSDLIAKMPVIDLKNCQPSKLKKKIAKIVGEDNCINLEKPKSPMHSKRQALQSPASSSGLLGSTEHSVLEKPKNKSFFRRLGGKKRKP